MPRAGGQDSYSSERTNGLLKGGRFGAGALHGILQFGRLGAGWTGAHRGRGSARRGADRRGRPGRDHRHRHPREPPQRAEHQARLRHGRRRDHRPGHRRAPRPLGDRGPAARSRRGDQPLRRQQRSRPLLGRGLGRRHSRPQLRPLRIQRPRHLLDRRLRPGDQLRRRPLRAARFGRGLQEPHRRDDRGRPVGHRQPQHPRAVRRSRLPFRVQRRDELQRLRRRLVADRQRPGQQYLGHRAGPLRPARELLLLAGAEPRRRPPRHQFPDPRQRRRRSSPTPLRHSGLPQSAAAEHRYDRCLPPGGAPCGTAGTAGAGRSRPIYASLLYAPLGGQFRTQDYDRERMGLALAAQWESPDRTALLTLQYLRSESTNSWGEHTFEAAPDLSEYNTYPAGCQQNGGAPNGGARADCRVNSAGEFFFAGNDRGNGYNPNPRRHFPNYEYDADGVFESGYITLPGHRLAYRQQRQPGHPRSDRRHAELAVAAPGRRRECRRRLRPEFPLHARRARGSSTSTPNM